MKIHVKLKKLRRNGRAAEGAPLLREYRVYSSIEGSNPSFSAIYIDVASINLDNASLAEKAIVYAPVAQLDRVLGYEPSGRRFESFQARHTIKKPHQFLVGLFYCTLFWKYWFVIRFEKIDGSNFSRPTGARRAAYREVGCNPSS